MIKKVFLVLAMMGLAKAAFSAAPQEMLKGYEAQSGSASSARGEQLFNMKHGKEWGCAFCYADAVKGDFDEDHVRIPSK